MINLWNHQQAAVTKFLADGCLFIQHQVGTGKTRTTIEAIRQLCNRHSEVLRGIILCPLIVCENWNREFRRWSKPALADQVAVLTGSEKKRIETFVPSNAKIFIMNHEGILMKSLWKEILACAWDFLVVDESHRFKNPTSKRTKGLLPLAAKTPHKILLTGTPVLQNVIDLQPQLRMIDENLVPQNWYEFRARFCQDLNAGMPKNIHFPNWQPRKERIPELTAIINKVSHKADKKEVLKDLPPLVRQTVFVELDGHTKKIYREMERDFITSCGPAVMHADLVLTKLIRLQQITAGIFKGDDGKEKSLPTPKLTALKELLEDIAYQHKTIIWTNFVHSYRDIASLCALLELPHVFIRGEQKPEERQQAVDAFQEDPNVRVCIANQSAGGIGINLQAASCMIYYSKSFALEHDLQSEARCFRGGSEIHEKILRIDILAKDTIDEDIHATLSDKLTLANLITRIKDKKDGTNRTETNDQRTLSFATREASEGCGA